MALKVFRAGVAAFERELDMTRRIEALRAEQRAPHLVQSLGTGTIGNGTTGESGRGWIAFEYLEGGSLQDLVSEAGPLAPGWALRFTCDAARALARLHEAGIFHRDVKPANLLLASDGKVRLGDFGLSRDLSGKLSTAGSPAFAAPEMIAGKVQDGRRADVYSLGATLFFLLTGETCHPGHPDVFALEACGVPGGLQLVLVAAMARAPEKRTGSVEEVLAALEELELPLEEARHVAAPQGPWRQTGAAAAAPAPRASAPARSSWWDSARARRRGVLGAAALCVLTLTTGAAAYLAGERSAAVEFRLEEPLPGLELRLGERELGPEPETLRLPPGEHVLVARREGVVSETRVRVEAGQDQVVSVRVRHPLRVEGAEGAQATLRDARGELVRTPAGWVLEGHPLPFEARLPLGRYSLELNGPDHHPRRVELELRNGGEHVRAGLRPIRRFQTRVEGLGFWSPPLVVDLDADGIQDLLFNGYDARDGRLVALSGKEGRVLWRSSEQTNRWASAVLTPQGEIAVGVLSPHEDPQFGLVQALFLEPGTGAPLRRANLWLASRPPITPTPFEIGGERGLFFVSDGQLSPPWKGPRLSAVGEGGVLWQREGPAGDGEPFNKNGLFARGIDRDGDGQDDAVLWELEGRIMAFAPGARGEVYWRSEETPASQRKYYWSADFDEVLAFASGPAGAPSTIVGLDVRGQVLWRHELERGAPVRRLPWLDLDGTGPRELVVSVPLQGGAEVLAFKADGTPLGGRRFAAEQAHPTGVLRQGGRRYLVVETLYPGRVQLLDPSTMAPVWSRDLQATRVTVSRADLDGDGEDSLVVSYRDGRVEVLDPDLSE